MSALSTMYAHHRWSFAIFLFCGGLFLANGLHFVLFRLLRRRAATELKIGWGLQQHLGSSARAIFLLTCVLITLPFVPGLPTDIEHKAQHVVFMTLVAALGWFFVGCVYVAQDLLLRKYDVTVPDNFRARRVHTQFQLFRRVAIALW
jgi:hypothetical protein